MKTSERLDVTKQRAHALLLAMAVDVHEWRDLSDASLIVLASEAGLAAPTAATAIIVRFMVGKQQSADECGDVRAVAPAGRAVVRQARGSGLPVQAGSYLPARPPVIHRSVVGSD